jgi:hypothetical protein
MFAITAGTHIGRAVFTPEKPLGCFGQVFSFKLGIFDRENSNRLYTMT